MHLLREEQNPTHKSCLAKKLDLNLMELPESPTSCLQEIEETENMLNDTTAVKPVKASVGEVLEEHYWKSGTWTSSMGITWGLVRSHRPL